jgi:hypothetical protein
MFSRGDLEETRRLAGRLMQTSDGTAQSAFIGLAWSCWLEGDADAAIALHEQHHQRAEQSGTLVERFMGALLVTITRAPARRDTTALIQQVFEYAAALRWPTAMGYAHYADGLASIAHDPAHSLAAFDRAIAIAVDVGNPMVEDAARRHRVMIQRTVLPRSEFARELIALLRLTQRTDNQFLAVLTLSDSVQILHDEGRSDTAGLVCGWLDRRSGQALDGSQYVAATAAVQASVGDRWKPLLERGHTQTFKQIVDLVCSELAHAASVDD